MSTNPQTPAAEGARPGAAPEVDVRRAGARPATRIDWLDSKHSFSFGHHFDPSNTHHGVLMVNNDDIVLPGSGFDTHPHRDMEIVTWVLDGSLVHQDSEGNSGVIYPGLAQRMSAGTGIRHSEKNDAWRVEGSRDLPELPVRFIQMWVLPDEQGLAPGYEQYEVDDARLRSGLVTVASGMAKHADETAIRINNRYAALHIARLGADDEVEVPESPYAHLFVARGAVDLEGAGDLAEGDAARLTGAGGRRVRAAGDAEVLVWEMHAGAA
jgi:redox-sensitive bicupin YhaK (pirin superfamily)